MIKQENTSSFVACVDTLASAVREMKVEKMDVESLEVCMDAAREMEHTVERAKMKIDTEQSKRPEFWRRCFRHDLSDTGEGLYDSREVTAELTKFQRVEGTTPSNWIGYCFQLKGEQELWVVRDFCDGRRDVIQAHRAHTDRYNAHRCDILTNRKDNEEVARDLGKTLYWFLTKQTNEPKEAVVALCIA